MPKGLGGGGRPNPFLYQGVKEKHPNSEVDSKNGKSDMGEQRAEIANK